MELVLISALTFRLLTDIFFKLSVNNLHFNSTSGYGVAFKKLVTNIYFWAAIFISAINFWLWINVLGYYDLSFAYPLFGVCYALIMIAGKMFFGEHLDWYKMIGIALILLSTLILVLG